LSAIRAGNLPRVQAVVANGHDVHSVIAKDRKQAIHVAAERGNLDIMKFLNSKGAALDARAEFGVQPMHLACRGGHIHVAEYLHETNPWEARKGEVTTDYPNHCPDWNCQPQFAHLGMMQEGEHWGALHASTDNGLRPMHYACDGRKLEMVKWLHSQGAALEARAQNRMQPYHSALESGAEDIVQWLTEQGAGKLDPSGKRRVVQSTRVASDWCSFGTVGF